jgi:hypothetical protein
VEIRFWGFRGSIAVSESYNLAATSVTAPAGVTLDSGYDLSVGTLTSGGAVDLSSSQGSITGIDASTTVSLVPVGAGAGPTDGSASGAVCGTELADIATSRPSSSSISAGIDMLPAVLHTFTFATVTVRARFGRAHGDTVGPVCRCPGRVSCRRRDRPRPTALAVGASQRAEQLADALAGGGKTTGAISSSASPSTVSARLARMAARSMLASSCKVTDSTQSKRS